MFSFFKKLFNKNPDNDIKKTSLSRPYVSVNTKIQHNELLLLKVKDYLRQKFNSDKNKLIFINTTKLYRGQEHNELPIGCSFWSEVESYARNYANPYLLISKPKDNLIFIEFKGFVDCLTGRFFEHEELSDYKSTCNYLWELSEAGFFSEFKGISGVIDTTTSNNAGHTKIFIFESSNIKITDIIKIPNANS
ncbi:hypothetical protein [Aeromonas hydrophila]|uniref:hypothetical protein n=1 Tax=Aeromonas hydrophila TaxID=644 RepID=UPI00191F18DE|nr:hypothetical protein [Aeromonas hydrophila]MBL0562681.1 hypothetical protein [Aeromonas hydrophila]